jgi:hypothetical protein
MDQPWAGKVLDISVAGVGLVLGRRFEPGTTLALDFGPTATGTSHRLLARVTRVGALPGRQWHLGCSLLSRLSEDKLLQLLDSVSRHASIQADVTFVSGTGHSGLRSFRARRFHVRGSWPLEAGTVLTLGLAGSQRSGVQLKLRVCDCFRQGQRWVIRYALAGTLSPDALQLLGHPHR